MNTANTQRVVLSVVSSVYDPIGLVAPYTVKARLLLKDIWRLNGQQWDDGLPNAVGTHFLQWSRELPLLSEIAIPRSYFQETVEGLELHLFGDSSQDIFSAAAFLAGKLVSKWSETTELAFAFGKTRVAPRKCLTNAKLELRAALLASQLRQGVQRAVSLNIERCFMWTDCTTVLQWLQSLEKHFFRVTEILELTTVHERNHVSRGDSPADAGTRGFSTTALFKNSL